LTAGIQSLAPVSPAVPIPFCLQGETRKAGQTAERPEAGGIPAHVVISTSGRNLQGCRKYPPQL